MATSFIQNMRKQENDPKFLTSVSKTTTYSCTHAVCWARHVSFNNGADTREGMTSASGDGHGGWIPSGAAAMDASQNASCQLLPNETRPLFHVMPRGPVMPHWLPLYPRASLLLLTNMKFHAPTRRMWRTYVRATLLCLRVAARHL